MIIRVKKLIAASIGPIWGPGLVFFISFLVYLKTMAPTIGPIDSGELSLVCQSLGIAHPTGYPLYTLVGRLWVFLIPFGELAWKLNLLSSLLMALSASWLYRIITELEIQEEVAFSSSLVYAFSPVIWQQAAFLEVYALTALLAMILLWLAVRYHNSREGRYLMLGSFLTGLGLGNHLSLLWLIPGLLMMTAIKPDRSKLRILWGGILFFIFGLSIYLFLPIRSNLAPLLNWGNPSNWERFFWHVSGKQYQVWMFNQSLGELLANLGNFAKLWLNNPSIYLWWLILPGIYVVFKKSKTLFWSLLTIFGLTVFYGINYSIPDIEAYFLPAFLVSFIFMAFGLGWLHRWLRSKQGGLGNIFAGAALALFILPMALNFRAHDNSRNRLAYAIAGNVLESAAPNAVILVDNWDIYSPCLYLMQEDRLRPDVILIDKELLRRSWYLDYLERRYPELYLSCRERIETFKTQLYPFEHSQPYDHHAIQQEFIAMINALLLTNYYDNPPYLTQNKPIGDYAGIAPDHQRIPEGLLYRLKLPGMIERVPDDFMFSGQLLNMDTLGLSFRDKMLYRMMPQMLYQRGVYLAQNLLFDQALDYFLQALRYERNKAALYLALGGTYAGLNRVEEASDAFKRALLLEPGNPVALENLRRMSMFLPGGPKGISTEIK
jgi:tetratricopeptide (TPR) repeat protein